MKKRYWNEPQMGFRERIYFIEIARGLGITFGVFFRNMWKWVTFRKGALTAYYPEEVRSDYSPNNRGRHVLTLRPNGDVQCVSCNMCATACPAYCIEITGADTGHDGVEKYPVRFDIDILQCVYCGLCVEACPCDAIRMDTGKITAAYYEGPVKILDLDYLLANHPEGKSPISDAIY
jgi:NADH-quinone oxidoreductase subunit I